MIRPVAAVAGPSDLRRLHRDQPSRYPFLLQSTTRGGELGRYDILFAFPGDTIVAGDEGPFLDRLDGAWQEQRSQLSAGELPFTGGWFLYLGYELAGEIEPALALARDSVLPTAFAVRCATAMVFDHVEQACWLVQESPCADVERTIRADLEVSRGPTVGDACDNAAVVEEDAAMFLAAVERAREYIAAGDVYQVNLSRAWTADSPQGFCADEIYAALCESNPGPFAGMARWGDIEIISSSPERLLRVRDGIATTRPIAGTRPRANDSEADGSLSRELITHPKERAEHVMLIDLERNDLGRICEPGSVDVDEMMVLESYAHVHHIVSNVRGKLRPDVTPGEAIAAVFPGGTITGCPKIRSMQIIAELEHSPRGPYTGSFGYLNLDGSLDINILIRTIVKAGSEVTFRAGSGIVADSQPVAELEETRTKAAGMLRAVLR